MRINIVYEISYKLSHSFVILTWNYLWSLKWPSGTELVKQVKDDMFYYIPKNIPIHFALE